MDISALSSGVYMLRINTATNSYYLKIIRQ
ncbi:MAG: T9SS type A sorting domain-containing protein [Bacteroidales bacterium]|nr:T9SS type A sorting domain-containing protein [Bacteroidales bacterium]